MNGLPATNQLITLRADTGQEFGSRVEGAGETMLTVARPLDLPVENDLRVGSRIMTAWNVENGVWVLPGQLSQTRREGVVPLWDITVIGDPWREQRRSYVRAAVMGTVALRGTSETLGGFEASAVIADLSEASVRCVTTDPALAAHSRTGTSLEISLQVGGSCFELQAEVARVIASDQPSQASELPQWQAVLVFVEPGRAADDLRRIVFTQQLRDRDLR
jgi:hypothetical protein